MSKRSAFSSCASAIAALSPIPRTNLASIDCAALTSSHFGGAPAHVRTASGPKALCNSPKTCGGMMICPYNLGQHVNRLDEDEITERRGISDDQHVHPGACVALRSPQ